MNIGNSLMMWHLREDLIHINRLLIIRQMDWDGSLGDGSGGGASGTVLRDPGLTDRLAAVQGNCEDLMFLPKDRSTCWNSAMFHFR